MNQITTPFMLDLHDLHGKKIRELRNEEIDMISGAGDREIGTTSFTQRPDGTVVISDQKMDPYPECNVGTDT